MHHFSTLLWGRERADDVGWNKSVIEVKPQQVSHTLHYHLLEEISRSLLNRVLLLIIFPAMLWSFRLDQWSAHANKAVDHVDDWVWRLHCRFNDYVRWRLQRCFNWSLRPSRPIPPILQQHPLQTNKHNKHMQISARNATSIYTQGWMIYGQVILVQMSTERWDKKIKKN